MAGKLIVVLQSCFVPLLAVGGAIAMYFVLRGKRSGAEPCCATCGYAVVGLPSSICPECGSDVEKAGVIPPRHRQPLARKKRWIIWTIAYLAIFWFIAMCAFEGPQYYIEYEAVKLVGPRSGLYRSVTYAVPHGWEAVGRWAPPGAALDGSDGWGPPEKWRHPYLGSKRLSLEKNDGRIVTREYVDYPDIAAFLKECGVDTTNPDVVREISMIAQAPASLGTDWYLGAPTLVTHFHVAGPPWLRPTYAGLAVIVYVGGTWAALRRRKRPTLAPSHPPSSSPTTAAASSAPSSTSAPSAGC